MVFDKARRATSSLRGGNAIRQKKAAAGFWSSRCHETPLKAPRGIKTVTAQPRYEYEVRAHHIFFYFVGLVAILSFLV
jgi:hypothetical protein